MGSVLFSETPSTFAAASQMTWIFTVFGIHHGSNSKIPHSSWICGFQFCYRCLMSVVLHFVLAYLFVDGNSPSVHRVIGYYDCYVSGYGFRSIIIAHKRILRFRLTFRTLLLCLYQGINYVPFYLLTCPHSGVPQKIVQGGGVDIFL